MQSQQARAPFAYSMGGPTVPQAPPALSQPPRWQPTPPIRDEDSEGIGGIINALFAPFRGARVCGSIEAPERHGNQSFTEASGRQVNDPAEVERRVVEARREYNAALQHEARTEDRDAERSTLQRYLQTERSRLPPPPPPPPRGGSNQARGSQLLQDLLHQENLHRRAQGIPPPPTPPQQRKGMTVQEVQAAIAVRRYSGRNDPLKENAQCAICMEDYAAGAQLGTLKCFHTFHQGCLLKWLQSNAVCPICRVSAGPPRP